MVARAAEARTGVMDSREVRDLRVKPLIRTMTAEVGPGTQEVMLGCLALAGMAGEADA
jgi:hypothetical protein